MSALRLAGHDAEPRADAGFHDLDTASDIESRPPVNITYTGRKTATDNSRKWSPWSIAANCCALIERQNGTAVAVFGGGLPGVGGGGATGKLYQLSDTQFSDDGTAIPSYYTTHFFPERAVESALGLGAHRKLFNYLTMYVEGAGNLALTSFVDSESVPTSQQPLGMSSPGPRIWNCRSIFWGNGWRFRWERARRGRGLSCRGLCRRCAWILGRRCGG